MGKNSDHEDVFMPPMDVEFRGFLEPQCVIIYAGNCEWYYIISCSSLYVILYLASPDQCVVLYLFFSYLRLFQMEGGHENRWRH